MTNILTPETWKMLKDLSKGSIGGIVLVGYYFLKQDYQEVKTELKAERAQSRIESREQASKMHELQNTVINENTKVMTEVRSMLQYKYYENEPK